MRVHQDASPGGAGGKAFITEREKKSGSRSPSNRGKYKDKVGEHPIYAHADKLSSMIKEMTDKNGEKKRDLDRWQDPLNMAIDQNILSIRETQRKFEREVEKQIYHKKKYSSKHLPRPRRSGISVAGSSNDGGSALGYDLPCSKPIIK